MYPRKVLVSILSLLLLITFFTFANLTTEAETNLVVNKYVLWHDDNSLLHWKPYNFIGAGTVNLVSSEGEYYCGNNAFVQIKTGTNNGDMEGACHMIPYIANRTFTEEYQFLINDIQDVSKVYFLDTDVYDGAHNYGFAIGWDAATKTFFYNTGNLVSGEGWWQNIGDPYTICSGIPYQIKLSYNTVTKQYIGFQIDSTYFSLANCNVGYTDTTGISCIFMRLIIRHSDTSTAALMNFWNYTISIS